jgi:hypothetical protein
MKLIVAFACVAMATSPALALEYDLQAAIGVAKVISSADACGYKIDQSGMDKHMAAAGLNSTAALGLITSAVSVAETPSEAECTAIRSTAKALGLIK